MSGEPSRRSPRVDTARACLWRNHFVGDKLSVTMTADRSGQRLAFRFSDGWQRQSCCESELGLQKAQGVALRTVVQSVVPDLAKADRQYVLEETPDELRRRQARGTLLSRDRIAIAEDDLARVMAQDGGARKRRSATGRRGGALRLPCPGSRGLPLARAPRAASSRASDAAHPLR